MGVSLPRRRMNAKTVAGGVAVRETFYLIALEAKKEDVVLLEWAPYH